MINGVDYTKSSEYVPNSKAVYAWTGSISYNKIETKSSSALELIKWEIGSTKDLVDKINNEKLDVKTISTSNPPASGSTLQNGVFTDNSGDGKYLFSITSNRKSGGEVYGKTSVSSEDIDLFGILKEYTYTWTETTPNYVGTTYRINAAQPIAILTTNKADSTINVTNEGNIIIDGDLKTSKVTSKGDVSLTAYSGAIVNAVDTEINMTGAADKISAWKNAGLISERDSANSATNSAKEEKAVRLNALENLFKRWVLKDDGTVDETLYRQFVNNTADKTNLTDEQIDQLDFYQELKQL